MVTRGKKEKDLLCGNKERQGSTPPIWFIKADNSLAFLDMFVDLKLERFSTGFITQFKSFIIIPIWGIDVNQNHRLMVEKSRNHYKLTLWV